MASWRERISRVLPPGARARAVATEAAVTRWLGRSGALRRLVRRRQLPLHLRRPYHVGVEVTAACNARCIMCPRHLMDRAMRPMAFPLFKKIVDECAALGVVEMALNGYGDIFTLRRERYREYIGYLRAQAPGVRVVINTNAYEMDESAARYLVEAGVHTVHTDIDGATPETFEKIRQYLRLAQVESNILRLVRIRDALGKTRPTVRVGIIAMPENRHEIPMFLAKWQGKADYVAVDGLINRMADPNAEIPLDQGRPCFELWAKLHIWADGKAVLCCEDWNAEHVVGDASTQSIEQIWSGAPLRKARAHHLAKTAGVIDLCRNCSLWRRGPYWWFDEWAVGEATT
ncbi:MAG: radical SAM protein [Gemmatimonadetes bacterium]|nr:radical SAM protein [Gemmatimonadota bacterium]